MTKPRIFISHITEEAEIANCLKDFVEQRFLHSVEVFASSHEQSIRLGDEWLNAIKDSLLECKLMIVICSPISVARPWINFESGAGWVRSIPVIPLCHSGLTPSRLPVPLNALQAGMLNNKSDIQKTFDRIAGVANISSPSAENEGFFVYVNKFETDIRVNLLLKDSTFIANLLRRNVVLLKYYIYASTCDYDSLNNFDVASARLEEHQFTFNDVYRLHNNLLLTSSFNQKVFQAFKATVQGIGESIRFILSNNHIEIEPELENQLNGFLYALPLVDVWYDAILFNDNQQVARELAIKLIKEWPLPPTKDRGNIINSYIDYYYGLEYYKSWLIAYFAIIDRLTVTTAQQQSTN